LSSVGCTESDLYFTVAEYLYKLEPSANAAVGLANRSLRNNDYETAIKYYNEAANLETDKSKAAEYLLQLAGIFSNQRNYPRARQAAYDALKYDPNNGKAYILIAQLYAASAGSIFQEPEKAGLVFCAAVDKLQKAKSVDPSVTAEANSLINKYSAYFMDTETAFMMGIKEGQSIFIPGWIGEKHYGETEINSSVIYRSSIGKRTNNIHERETTHNNRHTGDCYVAFLGIVQ
jgi:tetratricopeptide (TPR) repeat protein